MRKIESEMNTAIRHMLCDGDRPFCKQNTGVYRDDDGSIVVTLHGHRIAVITVNPDKDWLAHVRFDDCGWQTVTTKSRLNAIARELDVPGVYQKDYAWFFSDNEPFTSNRVLSFRV